MTEFLLATNLAKPKWQLSAAVFADRSPRPLQD